MAKDVKIKKDAWLSMRINHRLKEALLQLAREHNINLSEYLEEIIRSELREKQVSIEISEELTRPLHISLKKGPIN